MTVMCCGTAAEPHLPLAATVPLLGDESRKVHVTLLRYVLRVMSHERYMLRFRY